MYDTRFMNNISEFNIQLVVIMYWLIIIKIALNIAIYNRSFSLNLKVIYITYDKKIDQIENLLDNIRVIVKQIMWIFKHLRDFWYILHSIIVICIYFAEYSL